MIALRHLKIENLIMILLYKMNIWHTMMTLRVFDEFSNIAFFKLLIAHKIKSSFYLIVNKIQSYHKNVFVTIRNWIKIWKNVTFYVLTNKKRKDAFFDNENENTILRQQITNVINYFDEKLINLKKIIWKIQKKTIKKFFSFKKIEKNSKSFIANNLSNLSNKFENFVKKLNRIINNKKLVINMI